MITVALIELPAEGRYKVKIDDDDTGFFIARQEDEGHWSIQDDEDSHLTKQSPRSREGAAMLAAYLYFELERRSIERQRRETGAAS